MGVYHDFTAGNPLLEAEVETYLEVGVSTSWATATWADAVTLGNGTRSGNYVLNGKLCFFRAKLILGSTSAIGSSFGTVTVPTAAVSTDPMSSLNVRFGDVSAIKSYQGLGAFVDANTINFYYLETTTQDARADNLSSTLPFTWATSDEIRVAGWYEVA